MQFFLQRLLLCTQCFQANIQFLLKPLLFVLTVTTSAHSDAVKEPVTQLTLGDAFNLALVANPEIAVELHEQDVMRGFRVQSAARLNPSLETMVQDTRSETRETTLQINQEIELGNKRGARIDVADASYSKAEAVLESKKAEIHANVAAAFYGVLIAQERIKLAKSTLNIANLALDVAAKRVAAGKSSPVEETKSKIATATAKIALNRAISQLTNSRQRLSVLWGNTKPLFEQAVGDVVLVPETEPLTGLLALLDNAPAIKVAKMEINTRAAMTKVERSKSIPNITISAGLVNDQDLGRNQALLGLSIPIPLFDRNQGNVQAAISRKYQAEDALLVLKSKLATKLASEFERLTVARDASESLRTEILPSAESAFYAANKGFSAGKFDFLDVLDAQRTLFQAKSEYIDVLLEAHQAVAEIERVLGDVVIHQRKG